MIKSKKNIIRILIFSFIILIYLFTYFYFKNEDLKIEIISFSNLNGFIENENISLSKYTTAIKEWKRKNTFIISNGNNYYGTEISNLLKGKPIIDFFKEIDLSVSSVSYNDFIWGVDTLKESNINYILSNVYYKNKEKLFEPYIIKKYKGAKIAFISLMTEDNFYNINKYVSSNLVFKDYIRNLKKTIEKVKNKSDIIILLTDISIFNDDNKNIYFDNSNLNEITKIKDIDLIITNNESKLIYGLKDNILIIQNGNKKNIIKIIFSIKKKGFIKEVYDKKILIRDINNETLIEDNNIKNNILTYKKDVENIFNEKIFNLDQNLTFNEKQNSKLGIYFTNILNKITDSDISILTKNSFKNDLKKGEIKFKNIYNTFPYDTNIIKFKIKGTLLKDLFLKDKSLQYFGIKYKNKTLYLNNGEKVKDNNIYNISTNELFLMEKQEISKEIKSYDSYGNFRDLIIEYLKNN